MSDVALAAVMIVLVVVTATALLLKEGGENASDYPTAYRASRMGSR